MNVDPSHKRIAAVTVCIRKWFISKSRFYSRDPWIGGKSEDKRANSKQGEGVVDRPGVEEKVDWPCASCVLIKRLTPQEQRLRVVATRAVLRTNYSKNS